MRPIPDLSNLDYNAQQFVQLYKTPLGQSLWAVLRHPETLIRCETAAALGRSPVEILSPILVWEYGADALDMQFKQMVGHMLKQIMAALGYVPAPQERRIPGGSLFATGARYQRPDDGARPGQLTAAQREEWVEASPASPFAKWLGRMTQDSNGQINLSRLHDLAAHYGVERRFPNLSPRQQRMVVGMLIRAKAPPEVYG